MKPNAPPTQPRTLTIRRMYLLMKQSNLFDDVFQPADLLRCFTSAIMCSTSSAQAISLDDDSIELSFFELVEVSFFPFGDVLCCDFKEPMCFEFLPLFLTTDSSKITRSQALYRCGLILYANLGEDSKTETKCERMGKKIQNMVSKEGQ